MVTKKLLLDILTTLQIRVEDTKSISKEDPYLDAYIIQKKLLEELINILNNTPVAILQSQLIRWIELQQSVGSNNHEIVKRNQCLQELETILKKEKNNFSWFSIDLIYKIAYNISVI